MGSFKDINKARDFFMKGAKGVGNFVNPLENTVDFFRNTDKLQDLGNLQKTAKGFGEFYRDVRNVRLAYGESSLEGGMVENQMARDLLSDFKAEYNRMPNDEEAAKIRTTAKEAGVTTTMWNAPLIMMSNKVTMPGLVGGGMKRLGADVLTAGANRKIFLNAGAKLGENFTAIPKNYFKAKWHYIKNPKLIAGNMLKYGEANWMEGMQELGQETIASASESYYTDKYKGDVSRGGYMNHLVDNLGGGHGMGAAAETFLSGFLMGGMTAPLSMGISAAMRGKKGFEGTMAGAVGGKVHEQAIRMRYGKDSKEYTQYAASQKKIKTDREDKLNADVNMLNEIYTDPKQYFSPAMENLMEQKEYRKAMGLAEKNGDERTYYDMKDSSSTKHITTALKYGHYDTMVERLKDFTQYTPEEVAELQGNTLSHSEFQKEVGKSIEHAENIKQSWDKATAKYPNPFNPHQYQYNSLKYKEAALAANSWDKAVEEMVFNQASFTRSLARQKSILGSAKEVAGLENSPYSDFNILFVQKDGQAELNTLQKEIDAFEAGELVDPQAKALYAEKKEKKEKLEKALNAIKDVITNTNEGEEVSPKDYANVKKAYVDYMKFIAGKNGDFANVDALEDSLKQLLDYNLLSQRSIGANNAVNTLLDPKAFKAKFERINEIQTALHNNRMAEIKASLKLFRDKLADNDMLNELYEEGMFFSPEDLIALEKDGRVPNNFFYHADGEVSEVYMKKDDYKKAVGILKKHLKAKGIDINNININERFNPYQSYSRRKDTNDKRTYEDYAKEFGFDLEADESKVPLKDVLNAIIKSEYATPREVALAEKMLEIADDRETVTFSKGEKSPGLYSPSRGGSVIDAQYSSEEYKQGKNGHPIEHVILHEEIHRRTVESLKSDKEFRDEMQFLFEEAETAFAQLGPAERTALTGDPLKTLYGMANLEEFVAEAMSNDNFQRFLGAIQTDKTTNKSTWQKFVDLVMDRVEKFLGKRPDGTVLNAALDLVTAQIDKTFGDTASTMAPKSTGTILGAVNKDMSVAELKGQHPSLLDEILGIFKANQAQRKENGDDYFEGYENKTADELMNSTPFKQFLKFPNRKKDAAILNYNKKIAATATSNKKTVIPKGTTEVTDTEWETFVNNGEVSERRVNLLAQKLKTNVKFTSKEQAMYDAAEGKDENGNKTNLVEEKLKEEFQPAKIKSDELKKKVKALGYSSREFKNMTLAEANKLVKEGIHKIDRAAAKAAADASPDPVKAARATELQTYVDNRINDIIDGESYEAIEAELFAEVSNNPEYRRLAGITGDVLQEKLDAKLDTLAFSINFEDINVGEVLVVNNKYQTKAIVIAKTEDSITIEYLTKGSRIVTINKDQVEEKIKLRWSDALEKVEISDLPQATPEEIELAAQTVENRIGLQGIETDIKSAEDSSKEDRDNDLLDSICK
jgi:hypothetical protein